MVDGVLTRPAQARVPAWDRGLLYGEGVFESMRSYGQRVFALDEHLERLARSAGHVGLPLPVSLLDLTREVQQAHESVGGTADVAIRLIVTGGAGSRGVDVPTTSTRVVIVDTLVVPSLGRYEQGFSAVLMPGVRSPLGNAKTTSYLPHLIAARRARELGADEALLCSDGLVFEGATSNVFAVIAGALVTPPPIGLLAGVTRAHVLRLARALGIPTQESELGVETLRHASEAFLSSTFREIAPLTRLDGEPAFGGTPGPLTRRLHAQFRENTWAVLAWPRFPALRQASVVLAGGMHWRPGILHRRGKERAP